MAEVASGGVGELRASVFVVMTWGPSVFGDLPFAFGSDEFYCSGHDLSVGEGLGAAGGGGDGAPAIGKDGAMGFEGFPCEGIRSGVLAAILCIELAGDVIRICEEVREVLKIRDAAGEGVRSAVQDGRAIAGFGDGADGVAGVVEGLELPGDVGCGVGHKRSGK